MKSFVISFLIILSIIKFNKAICPSRCYCYDQKLETSCIDAGLEVVPIQLNPEVQIIILKENRISNVHYTLSFYIELRTLDLSVNKINVLGSHNFEFQNKLLSLNISYNEISTLSKDTFKGLKVLKILDLSYNKISSIHKTAFRDTISLEVMILSFNNITSFEENDVFITLKNLRILKLDNNQIMDVPSNVLSNLPHQSLHFLYLNDNLIDDLVDSSFPFTMTNLHTLSLKSNILSKINETSFITLRSLHTLDLSGNNLSVIPTKQLSKLSVLVHLDISGNNFNSIDSVAFKSLFSLKEVKINLIPNLMFIDQRAFVDNIQLETVIINENMNLKQFPLKLFQGNSNLKAVSLKGNALTSLEAAHFPLERITFLDLSDNPLHCNCNLLWLWILVQLQVKTTVETTTSSGEISVNSSFAPVSSTKASKIEKIAKNNHTLTIILENLKCSSPLEIKGKELKDVSEKFVHCETNTLIYLVALMLLILSSVVICILMFFIYRKRMLWKDKINKNLRQGSYSENYLNSHPTPILMLYSTPNNQYESNEKSNGFPNEKMCPNVSLQEQMQIYDKYTGNMQVPYNEEHIYEKEPLTNKFNRPHHQIQNGTIKIPDIHQNLNGSIAGNENYQTLNGAIPRSENEYYPRKIPINDSFRGKISKINRNNFPGKFASNENFNCSSTQPSFNSSLRKKAPSSQDVQYFDQWKNHSSGVYANPHEHNNGIYATPHDHLESTSQSNDRRYDTNRSRSSRKQHASPHIVYV